MKIHIVIKSINLEVECIELDFMPRQNDVLKIRKRTFKVIERVLYFPMDSGDRTCKVYTCKVEEI